MLFLASCCILCSCCLISLCRSVCFFLLIWPRYKAAAAVKMDTRALRNPYYDYDGSPASTQALFDSQGKVIHKGNVQKNANAQNWVWSGDSILHNCFFIPLHLQLTSEFAQRLSSKISELLAVMENGLKSADPRDCTSYTGWAGDGTIMHVKLHYLVWLRGIALICMARS